ncbi:Hypothetical predicted protein [Pelobates cultripes]|uniref:Uncharacterized protein n=1 Tax=Pelobates cultripes TaxID=61616 RepID=A0AAD1WDB1_PELCU|nr:Hypothetical predicted protein [Pelobates cultripes]
MGRRNKKPDKPPSTADIGELLRRPQNFQRPDTAPQLEGLYHSFSETTESEEEDYGTGVVGRPIQSPMKPSLTEEKLKVMLGELRRNIAADIGVFRDEISGVVACLQNAELNTAAQESHLASVEQQILTLQKTQKQHQINMAALEDKRRGKNVKIRSLPEEAETTELPHLIRRLLNTLFKPKKAKGMPLDSCFRISGQQAGTPVRGNNVIVRLQQGRDRQTFMAAVRSNSPFHFESHSLTFYPDLSKATMDWRRPLRPLTTELIAHNIPYR